MPDQSFLEKLRERRKKKKKSKLVDALSRREGKDVDPNKRFGANVKRILESKKKR